jgi:hypothetical protein
VALVAAAIGVLGLIVILRSRGALLAPAPSVPSVAVLPAAPARMLGLNDGSRVSVEAQADVRVAEDQPSGVRLLHLGGKAFYDVQPNPARPFTVRVADVTVRVRGTQFSVELSDEWVEVRVTRGRVVVDDGARATELVAGEVIRVRAWRSETPPVAGSASAEAAPAGSGAAPGESAAPAASRPGAAAPEPVADGEPTPSVEALLARADAARAAGRGAEAAQALRTLLARYPRDPRRPTVLFTLARVLRSQGQHAAAAETFEQCARLVSRAPSARTRWPRRPPPGAPRARRGARGPRRSAT